MPQSTLTKPRETRTRATTKPLILPVVPAGARAIALRPEGFAIVDEADFNFLTQWNWRRHTTGHAMRLQREHYYQRGIYMHRLIMDCPDGMVVDHINGDKLDNRRSNLRICTQSQNLQNQKGRGASRFLGVRRDNRRNKWVAEIKIEDKRKHLGAFDSEEDAAKAYDRAARQAGKTFTRLNFPEGGVS